VLGSAVSYLGARGELGVALSRATSMLRSNEPDAARSELELRELLRSLLQELGSSALRDLGRDGGAELALRLATIVAAGAARFAVPAERACERLELHSGRRAPCVAPYASWDAHAQTRPDAPQPLLLALSSGRGIPLHSCRRGSGISSHPRAVLGAHATSRSVTRCSSPAFSRRVSATSAARALSASAIAGEAPD
jgi:hypothetical protein